jgi:hypothetical protein
LKQNLSKRLYTASWEVDEKSPVRISASQSIARAAYCSIYAVIPLGTEGITKVGVASDLKDRLRGLQTCSHVKLHVAACGYVSSRDRAMRIEAKAHQILKEGDRLIRGEWFRTTPEKAIEVIKFAADVLRFPFVQISRKGIDRLLAGV